MHVISASQNEENVNDNYSISVLVHEKACQTLEGQKTSATKCDSYKEKGGDLWIFLTKYIKRLGAHRICCIFFITVP